MFTIQKSPRITLIKDYDGNDPVEEGWYDWHKLDSLSESTPKFRILIKSDKSRQMYGFKLGIQELKSFSLVRVPKCSGPHIPDSS